MRSLRLAPALLALLLPFFSARAQDTLSLKLTERVTDLAGVLSSSDRESIASELKSYEDSTGNQFIVLTVPSLNGEPIEQFALRVAQGSGIGRDDNDNGLLMVVAIAERKIRIEVGYGLEGALPDVLTMQIREQEITPRFKEGNYAEGIRQGMRALMAAAAGEYTGTSAPFYRKEDDSGIDWLFLAVVFGPFLFVGLIIFITIRAARRSGSWRRGGSSSYESGGSATWVSTDSSSWSSGDSSSSSSSDSSFSGGGGDFGGGGSTGDW